MSSKNSFTSSFLIWMPFISSYCLISLARTSSIMLNRSGEDRHLCLVLDHRGKALSLSPLNLMLAVQAYLILLCFTDICVFLQIEGLW